MITFSLIIIFLSSANAFVTTRTAKPSNRSLRLSLQPQDLATSLSSADGGAAQLETAQLPGVLLDTFSRSTSGTLASTLEALEQIPLELRAALAVLPVVTVVAPNFRTVKPPEEPTYPEKQAATYELLDRALPWEFGDAAFVRPLLKQTQLEYRKLRVTYDARKDGYDAKVFHQKVDGQGAAIVLAKAGGQWFDGYNPRGWASLGGSRSSVASFLFYKPLFGRWQKLRALGGGGMSCGNDLFDCGILMGAEGLAIPLNGDRRKMVASRLGTYFEVGPNRRSTLLPKAGVDLQLQELKVLVGVYAPGEDIPNSGGVIELGQY